jgi:hypothetical protein
LIKNNFFLLAGILSLVFAAGHVFWGQENVIARLQTQGIDSSLVALVQMGWNLPASTTFLSGLALLYASSRFISNGALPLAWFILSINVGRYLLLLVTVGSLETYDLFTFIAQSAGVCLYIGVIYLGIRKTPKGRD